MTPRETMQESGVRYARVMRSVAVSLHSGASVALDHDHDVAVFRLSHGLYAISNVCPHKHAAILCKGYVDSENDSVTCPMHGWRFSIVTGAPLQDSSSVRRYACIERHGWIWVEWPEEDIPSWAL